jgi:hypothetical protein
VVPRRQIQTCAFFFLSGTLTVLAFDTGIPRGWGASPAGTNSGRRRAVGLR